VIALTNDETRRDRLAAMAMQGLMANPALTEESAEEIAAYAYRQADCMIARGNRPQRSGFGVCDDNSLTVHPEDIARDSAAALDAIADKADGHLLSGHVSLIRSAATRIREFWDLT
jgi:hypothetical protein